jgi:hypothetical protein
LKEFLKIAPQRWRKTEANREKRLEKSPCKSMEQKENHEKAPRGSWANNHMGNPRLNASDDETI